jgi:hypothetical protein
MRVTKDTLVRIAKETVQQRAYNDKKIVAAYLFGSLLTDEPFLGGLTDIDLVFVYADQPPRKREIVPLPGDFHIDITFHARKEYDSPRDLRTNPWLGCEIYDPQLLFEREHFFEFVQAGVRAGSVFDEPVNVLKRCRSLLTHGRQIWMDLQFATGEPGPQELAKYLKSILHAVNAIAELNGAPLPERRLLLDFPARAQAAGTPGSSAGLLGLLGAPQADAAALAGFLPHWQADFLAAGKKHAADERLHPARQAYYHKAFEAMLGSDHANAMLWPLLQTWSMAACTLPAEKTAAWQKACQSLGLLGKDFEERVAALDSYLDQIEELLEEKAAANGLDVEETL